MNSVNVLKMDTPERSLTPSATLRTLWEKMAAYKPGWRRETLPTLVFWPKEFCGLYSPWGRKELDTTK